MRPLIIASKNKGKINEIKQILQDLPLQILSMNEAGIDMEIEEKGTTFHENAMLKAQTLFDYAGGMILADDSGLEIDFLNGAPGIYTARFAGESASQDEKNTKLVTLLKDVDEPYRTARFVCSIAFVSENERFVVNGSVDGIIAHQIEGNSGFGYDPIFYVPEYKQTFAQLPEEIKNSISHRAKALEQLREKLTEIFGKKV